MRYEPVEIHGAMLNRYTCKPSPTNFLRQMDPAIRRGFPIHPMPSLYRKSPRPAVESGGGIILRAVA